MYVPHALNISQTLAKLGAMHQCQSVSDSTSESIVASSDSVLKGHLNIFGYFDPVQMMFYSIFFLLGVANLTAASAKN